MCKLLRTEDGREFNKVHLAWVMIILAAVNVVLFAIK